MIKLQGKLPKKISVAVSGGVDSMVALDFLKKKHEVTVLHYNHGTAHGMEAENFVTDYCRKNALNFITDNVNETVPPGRSREDWWRDKRYKFFDKFNDYDHGRISNLVVRKASHACRCKWRDYGLLGISFSKCLPPPNADDNCTRHCLLILFWWTLEQHDP